VSRGKNDREAIRGLGMSLTNKGHWGEGAGLLSSHLLGLWASGKLHNL